MKILLDECVTKKIIPLIPDHELLTVSQMKWNGLKNGELLKRMEEHGFEMLITIDKNINYQQNISRYNIILVIINSRSSAIEALSSFIPNLMSKMNLFEMGKSYIIEL